MKKKDLNKKNVFIINTKPYKQECVVVVNGEFEDAYKIFKELAKKGSEHARESLKHIDENKDEYFVEVPKSEATLFTKLPYGYIMILNLQDGWLDTVGYVSHESTHLTHYILEKAGVTLCRESEEAYTYLQEQIMVDILDKIYN